MEYYKNLLKQVVFQESALIHFFYSSYMVEMETFYRISEGFGTRVLPRKNHSCEYY
jgi:hypothetical protein